MNTLPPYRQQVWAYLSVSPFAGLAAVAKDIALGTTSPPPLPGFPPLNLLVNGTDPNTTPKGLAGITQGTLAAALAQAKGSANHGFQATHPHGLSILFGTWSDFCLWCWAKHPVNAGATIEPTIILAKDHDSFAGLNPMIAPGIDWGAADLAQFYLSQDPSTVNLFGAILRASGYSASPNLFGPKSNSAHQAALEQFIASKRVFIYNMWPWLRSGAPTTGNANVHDPLHKVPTVISSFQRLLHVLKPSKIACLGAWSWDTTLPSPDALMRRSFLPTNATASAEVFRHPSAYARHGWTKPWRNPAAWGTGFRWAGRTSEQAFIDFVR